MAIKIEGFITSSQSVRWQMEHSPDHEDCKISVRVVFSELLSSAEAAHDFRSALSRSKTDWVTEDNGSWQINLGRFFASKNVYRCISRVRSPGRADTSFPRWPKGTVVLAGPAQVDHPGAIQIGAAFGNSGPRTEWRFFCSSKAPASNVSAAPSVKGTTKQPQPDVRAGNLSNSASSGGKVRLVTSTRLARVVGHKDEMRTPDLKRKWERRFGQRLRRLKLVRGRRGKRDFLYDPAETLQVLVEKDLLSDEDADCAKRQLRLQS